MALDVKDLREDPQGLRVLVRRSKVDQEGRGFEKAIPHGRFIRPVALVREWLDAAQISAGPVFRPVNKAGRVEAQRLGVKTIERAIKHYCTAAGLDLRGALPAGRLHHHGSRARRRPRPDHGSVRPPGSADRGWVHSASERLQGALGERVPIIIAPY